MAVKASRTSSSLNGLMIAITIFMGPIPAWAQAGRDRAFSTEVHHAEKFTTRAQPAPVESNAVPDRSSSLTDYERGPFRVFPESPRPALFGRAQSLVISAQNEGTTDSGHNRAHGEGRKTVFGWGMCGESSAGPAALQKYRGPPARVRAADSQARAANRSAAWPRRVTATPGRSQARRRCRMRRKWQNLERVAVGFAGPDPQGVIDRRHKNLAVADLAGARARGDDVHRLVGKVRRDGDFDSKLRQKIHDIFGAAVDLGVAFLAAVTLDLGHGHPADADRGECLAHLVKFEWFDNGNNELHGQAFIPNDFRKRRFGALRPSLASFCANGTKSLQPRPKNNCRGAAPLSSLPVEAAA